MSQIFFLLLSASFAFANPELMLQSFNITDSYFIPAQNKIQILVSFDCGCGQDIFKFKNFRKNQVQKKQEIDLERMSNNSCKMACHTWEPLLLSDFPEISVDSDLIIHAIGWKGNDLDHQVDFKKTKPNAKPDLTNQGVFKKLKKNLR